MIRGIIVAPQYISEIQWILKQKRNLISSENLLLIKNPMYSNSIMDQLISSSILECIFDKHKASKYVMYDNDYKKFLDYLNQELNNDSLNIYSIVTYGITQLKESKISLKNINKRIANNTLSLDCFASMFDSNIGKRNSVREVFTIDQIIEYLKKENIDISS